MAEHVKRVQRTTSPNGDVTETTRETRGSSAAGYSAQNLLTNIIWFVCGVLLVLLAFRFILALLGANPSNWFANFIYTVSHPFVAPFFGLFSYNYHYGVSRFEIYTLVAMVVYAVIAWILSALVNLNRRDA